LKQMDEILEDYSSKRFIDIYDEAANLKTETEQFQARMRSENPRYAFQD
jgi:hypothetical protein